MKSRVRMIVVLVCVFVVLPVVGGLVYLSRISAEAAVRHYADELRPETWTRLMVAVMRLPVGPDPGILPGSGP